MGNIIHFLIHFFQNYLNKLCKRINVKKIKKTKIAVTTILLKIMLHKALKEDNDINKELEIDKEALYDDCRINLINI